MPPLNTVLFELFRAHDVKTVLRDDDVLLPENGMTASASVVKEMSQTNVLSIQMDVRFTIAPGLTIVESFAGIGADKEQAVGDAVRNFAANSLHVLLAAFLGEPSDQATQERWDIGGRQRIVTAGNIGVRGRLPGEGEAMVAWADHFRERMTAQNLGPETHWIRIYYAQSQGKMVVCEVLRDNETWAELQSAMTDFAWPSGEDFYSVRLFLVIAGDDSVMTPKRAVSVLDEIVTANPDAAEDEIYQSLADAEIPEAMAHRAFLFTQIAWGRLLLATMPITLSPDYFYLDAAGNVIESGRVAEEPYFLAATEIGSYADSKGFQRLALSSADVNAVNDLLNKGVPAEDLFMAPSFLFTEAPTAAGMAKAQKFITEQSVALRAKNAPGTEDVSKPDPPRWQFWKRKGK